MLRGWVGLCFWYHLLNALIKCDASPHLIVHASELSLGYSLALLSLFRFEVTCLHFWVFLSHELFPFFLAPTLSRYLPSLLQVIVPEVVKWPILLHIRIELGPIDPAPREVSPEESLWLFSVICDTGLGVLFDRCYHMWIVLNELLLLLKICIGRGLRNAVPHYLLYLSKGKFLKLMHQGINKLLRLWWGRLLRLVVSLGECILGVLFRERLAKLAKQSLLHQGLFSFPHTHLWPWLLP